MLERLLGNGARTILVESPGPLCPRPHGAARKSLVETNPEAVALAKRLARKKPKGRKLSLRAISAELAAQGFLNERGKPFNPKPIASMLTGQETSSGWNRPQSCPRAKLRSGEVQGESLEIGERAVVECTFVSSPQDHKWRVAGLQRLAPARRTQAPAVAGPQAGKTKLGHRR